MEFDDCKRRLAPAGLKRIDAAKQQMFAALPLLEALCARIHAGGDLAEEVAAPFGARVRR